MKLLKQIEWYFFPLRKPDLEVEALLKDCEDAKLLPKNISEPVISFVECVRNNPRRFKLTESQTTINPYRWTILRMYTLKDKFSGEVFTASRETDYRYGETTWKFPTFVTKDEGDFLAEQLPIIFSGKLKNLVRLKTLREERKTRVERDRLKSIYYQGSIYECNRSEHTSIR
jgi:hypothetical protein